MPEFDRQRSSQLVIEAVKRMLKDGGTGTLVTVLDGVPYPGAKLLISDTGVTTGSLGAAQYDVAARQHALAFLESGEDARMLPLEETEARVLFERIQPEARLVICGAGHVGAALAKLASLLQFAVTLIDDREAFVSRERFPAEGIRLVKAQQWAEAVRQALGNGHGVAVAIVTRGHSEDEQCLRVALETGANYVGMIGSKRRTNIVLQRLRDDGVAAEKLAAVHAPVGLDIGAVTPEEVALAILAEIVLIRRGGTGGSLSAWRRNVTTATS